MRPSVQASPSSPSGKALQHHRALDFWSLCPAKNSHDVGVKLPKGVLQQVEELEEGIIKEEILPALISGIAPRLEPISRDLVLVVEYHPGKPISVALSRKAKISEIMGAKTLTPRSSTPVKSEAVPVETDPHEPKKHIENTTKGMKVTFPDGTVVWHRQAIDTFIDSLSILTSATRPKSKTCNASQTTFI